MENNTLLVFLFVISIGILFVGSGITGLYAIDIDALGYCDAKHDCENGMVCCAFQEGDEITRVCAEDCRSMRSLSQEVNYNEQTLSGFAFDITGSDVQNVKKGSDYWIFIIIGIVLILLALFYKRNPTTTKKVTIQKKVKKKKRKRKR